MTSKAASFLIILALLLPSCQRQYCDLEPEVCYTPQRRHISKLPSPFAPLTPEEHSQDWGKEVTIATAFAKDLDLYRAITTFKRALVLLPAGAKLRRLQIHYNIAMCYYLGKKYRDVINTVECSELLDISDDFPGYRELLIILYDSYQQCGYEDKACKVLELMNAEAPDTAVDLSLSTATRTGDLPCINKLACDHPQKQYFDGMLCDYRQRAKSVSTAQTLSGLIPGAGYLYVGQCRTALTSFLLNGLFIWATIRFFEEDYIAAGILTASFEMGWYLGGIHGAALAAKQYNESLYECYGKEMMLQQRLFPVLMFSKGF